MAVTIDGTSGINTPGVVNTAAETIATTLAVTGVTTFAAGTAALPAITTTGDTNTGIFFPAADTIAFSEGGAEAMRIDSSGNLGIGTASPVSKLNVNGGSVTLAETTTGVYNIDFQSRTASTNARIQYDQVSNTTGQLLFYTNGGSLTERMRIDSSGNLLVGTTSTDLAAVGIRLMNNNQVQASKSSDWSFRMGRRDSTGIITEIYYNSNRVGDIATNGTGTFYSSASDYRLKEAVAPMTGALAKVSALKPCTYTWKSDGSDGQGFIAHELQEVVPDCVTGTKDATREEQYEVTPAVKDENGIVITEAVMGTRTVPDYQSIDTSFLVATLTAAIQEQQALITALTTRITALEAA